MGLTAAELAEVVAEGASTAEAVGAGTVAATAADAAAAGGAASAESFAIPAALTSAAKSFAVSFALAKLFARDVNLGQGGTGQTFLANTLSNADPIPVIYGSRRVGASVIELGITATEVQADRLHRIAIWGEGPISAVQALLLDTKAALDPVLFAPGVVANIEHYTGTDGQAASAALIAYFADASRWNASCTLAGVAYTYFNLVWNPDYFPHGRPVVTADVDGRTLYDPRTTLTAFSRNPALALRDYLTNTRYGRSVPTSMIDDTAFSEAAWHCDDQVAIPDGNGGTTLQARYTCDGVLNVDQSALDNLRALLTSCRGFLVFSGGKYKLKIDRGYFALSFDASTARADMTGIPVDTSGGGKNTYECWVNWDGTFPLANDVAIPLIIGSGGSNRMWLGFVGASFGNKVAVGTWGGDVYGVSNAGMANRWVHLAAVYVNGAAPSGGWKLYVDGALQSPVQSGVPGTPTAGTQLRLGIDFSNANKFRGKVDGVRVYNRELSATEVVEHYAGTFSNETGLVGRWEFDEGQGTTVFDWSGNGHNGALAGAAAFVAQQPGYAKFVLSADNIVGGWSIQLGGKRNRFNRVRCRFFNKDASWQPDYAVWPDASAAAQAATWLAQDANQVLEQTLDLPFTRNIYTAAQIAQIEAKRSRFGTLVSLTATIAATCLEVGDVVPIAHATPGWPSGSDPAEGKLFRVIEMELLSSDEVRLTLLEYQASVYQLVALAPVAVSSTSLPDMTLVAAPLNVAAASGTDQLLIAGDGTVISRMKLSWDRTLSVFVSRGGQVIVQFRKSSETEWQSVPPLDGTATQAYLTPVDDAVAYDVRVAFENSISARSAWVQIAHTVVGKTQPPADVTGFQVSGTRLTWNPVTDADLWGYRLRLQPGSSQSWGDAIWLHGQGTAQQDVVTTPPFTLPIAIVGQATLMVKAVDLSGNESQNAAILIANLTGPAIANVVQTFDRKAAGFPGTQTNCAVDGSGNLAANSTTLMWSSDDRASMWKADSTQLVWAAAAFAQLQYTDTIVTAGARAGSTLTLSAAVQGDPWKIEYRENSTKSMWSADASSPMWNANSATLMWDAPTYLTWPGQATVFPDSMFDFRITAGQAQTQGKITGLTVTLDAPDITETIANVAISSGGTRLAPTKSYGTVKSVHLTVVSDGGTAVSGKQEDTQATGPLVKTYDGTGVAVTGHVNARIEGY